MKDSIIDLSKSERETLKAIYRMTVSMTRSDADAHTGDLAEVLEMSPGSVTAIVKRLTDRGLTYHRPYRGAELTEDGHRAALSAIRRHRIVERFLADMLGYAWNEADRLAPLFEHQIPQEVEDRMYMAMDRPTSCPHGFPIPETEQAELPDMPALYSLEPGDSAVVAMPGSIGADVVAFLEELGIHPGVHVRVREKHPFDGPMVLIVEGQDRTMSEKVARQIYVSKDLQDTEQTA